MVTAEGAVLVVSYILFPKIWKQLDTAVNRSNSNFSPTPDAVPHDFLISLRVCRYLHIKITGVALQYSYIIKVIGTRHSGMQVRDSL